MSRLQVIGAIAGAIAAVFSIIATIIGATWMLSEKINEVRVEFHKEIAEVRVEFRKEIGNLRDEIRKEIAEVRVEIHKENSETRDEIGNLRGDVINIGSKFDEFKESHRREHDILYDSAERDRENSSAN